VLLTRAGLDTWRRQHRGDDPEVDTALVALTLAAIEYRNRLYGNGHRQAPITVTDASCALTTARAADRLGCSQRTITRAIHTGRLTARRVGWIWLIDPEQLQHYAEHNIRQTG
jgi:excisionase family DNA binding protein